MSKPQSTQTDAIEVRASGVDLLRDPMLNKGTAFTVEERREFHLEGLLPYRSKEIEQQASRIYEQLQSRSDPLQKYVMLSALRSRNSQLFHRVLRDHIEELMPVVYTPTVGLATQRFSHVFQGGGGLWITPHMRNRMAEVLRRAAPSTGVRLLVVTDNEAILGLGDQGAGGMAISVGKLALYSAGAGIHPAQVLPISLDFGTDNEELLADDQYLGWPERRLRGAAYDELVEEFVDAVAEVLPGALVQWEDFRKDNALRILDRFAGRVPSFNDDIQGTGAVVMAGVKNALRIKSEPLASQRVVVLGAGAAGLGIARQIKAQLKEDGLPALDRQRAVAVLDRRGLLVEMDRHSDLYKQELSWPGELAEEYGFGAESERTFAGVVRRYRPTVLIGVSGQGGAFGEEIVREMAKHVEQPIIFPSSNPVANSEARPEDLYAWTDGRCLVAAGSPFPDVEQGGRRYRVGQGNNVFIFPGLGLGALAARATSVTAGMIAAASSALADQVTESERSSGLLFPSVARLCAVSYEIACAVARRAGEDGVAGIATADPGELVRAQMWEPEYRPYRLTRSA
jgi:malate dehydrogenase (oxaloacetate-decarboxylating)